MTTLPIRGDLAGASPFGAPQLEVAHALNVNENPYSPGPKVAAAIAAAVAGATGTLNRYPDREFLDLRADLADYLEAESGVNGLTPEQIWAANGSNEILLHLFQGFGGPGRVALGFSPTYSMYPEYARDTFTEWVFGTRNPDYTLDAQAVIAKARELTPALIILASPNNPTGTALPIEDIAEIAAATTSTGPDGAASILVIDEAYAEFRREGSLSALTLLDQFPHMVISRTMSKAFALAGVRLGYLAAAADIVDVLRIVRLPYHLSAVTQAVARAALSCADILQRQVAELRESRDALAVWLNEHGFRVADSDANFIMFGEFEDRRAVWQGLLDRGVLIRETGPEQFLRVSIGTPEQNQAFMTALLEVTAR